MRSVRLGGLKTHGGQTNGDFSREKRRKTKEASAQCPPNASYEISTLSLSRLELPSP